MAAPINHKADIVDDSEHVEHDGIRDDYSQTMIDELLRTVGGLENLNHQALSLGIQRLAALGPQTQFQSTERAGEQKHVPEHAPTSEPPPLLHNQSPYSSLSFWYQLYGIACKGLHAAMEESRPSLRSPLLHRLLSSGVPSFSTVTGPHPNTRHQHAAHHARRPPTKRCGCGMSVKCTCSSDYIHQKQQKSSYDVCEPIGYKRRQPPDRNKWCANCKTADSPFWRRDRLTAEHLCNACGLYQLKRLRSPNPEVPTGKMELFIVCSGEVNEPH